MPHQKCDSRGVLIVLAGATGVGKTSFAISLSQHLGGVPILSADSRQFFRELPIGTAMPTAQELSLAPHHFIACRSIHDEYSMGQYEVDLLECLSRLFATHSVAILCGGSTLYIDAICRGVDDIPAVDPEVRTSLMERYRCEGLDGILAELRIVDPVYYARVDRYNYRRVIHALEVYLSSGKPFSSYHHGKPAQRPFALLTYALTLPRDTLYHRINLRVESMMQAGLLDEVRALVPYRHLNALNTIGYKELFAHLDGAYDLAEAVRRIQRNSRRYARTQLTWQRRHPEFRPLDLTTPLPALLNQIEQDLAAMI